VLGSWFPGVRVLVYLRSIARSLSRIADAAEVQSLSAPKRSRRGKEPDTEILKPTVKEWNDGWRERNADLLLGRDEEEEP
jgi:hypothetical protein